MKSAHFVLADKVPGLAVLVSMPVGPASAEAMEAAMTGHALGESEGNVELGAACAAAAGRIQGKLAGPGGLKTTRAASVEFGVHEGCFCVGVVTDKTPARVKAVVKAVLAETARVSAGEHNRYVRGLGQSPKHAEECLKALAKGAAGATVIVCGPLPKPEKQRQAVDKAKEGAAAAKAKGGEEGGKDDLRAAKGVALLMAAEKAEARLKLKAKGVALSVLNDYARGALRLGGTICGDALAISQKSGTAAANAGDDKDKQKRLQSLLEKPGEMARAYWRACAQAVDVGTSVPQAKAVAEAVFKALGK